LLAELPRLRERLSLAWPPMAKLTDGQFVTAMLNATERGGRGRGVAGPREVVARLYAMTGKSAKTVGALRQSARRQRRASQP